MIGSIIVWGNNLEDRKKTCIDLIKSSDKVFGRTDVTAHPDILMIERDDEKKTIGIDEVKPIINFLNQKPFNAKIKAVVIYEAEKLTVEAQNSLLKTLEEPPIYALILLGSKNENSLLDTIISRCRKIKSNNNSNFDTNSDSTLDVIKSSIKSKLDWAEETSKSEREEVIEILENMIRSQRTLLAKNSDSAKNIREIVRIKTDIEKTNVNMRLALEYLITSLK